MTDYTNTFDGPGKLSREDQILAVDFDTEFDSIQTAVNSKIDKVGSPTLDDFADHAAGGAIADSGVLSTYFNTLTSNVQTQFDALQLKVAQATGHVRSGILQCYEGTATAINLASGRSSATWYKVGPTGSGADIIWADLDDTPTSAQGIYATLRSKFDVQVSSQADARVQLRIAQDEDETAGSHWNIVYQNNITHPVTGDFEESLQINIPLASDNTFDVYMDVDSPYDLTDWTNVELIYNGFVT